MPGGGSVARMLWAILPIAVLVTITPGAATANAIRSAIRVGRRSGFRDGLVTSPANPKLAILFVALFAQFVGDRGSVLPTTLLMIGLIVIFDFAWYTTLAVLLVGRAKAAFTGSRLARRLERATGAVLIALGARVAFEQR
jgi:threonine/homoserine/homoserine lactone efflux protein